MISADSRALIETLVAFDTVSAKSNLALIEFLRERLAEHGVAARLVHDETGGKANLYATIGPQDRPGVLLSGHSDVVPVAGQAWASDPFSVAERMARGDLQLHGWIYDIRTGSVLAYDESGNRFVPVQERYADAIAEANSPAPG